MQCVLSDGRTAVNCACITWPYRLPSQIFGKGAKFSMFKPAEEMVYIGLDEESRTKGKAAIDVVGAQSGKSLGSVLQQALLLATGGALAGASGSEFRVRAWARVSVV